MLTRSVRNPLLISLGAGIVLIVGTAPPVFAAKTPAPSPSGSPSGSPSNTTSSSPSQTPTPTPTPTTPPTPVLRLAFQDTIKTGQPGSSYPMEVLITVAGGVAKDIDLTLIGKGGANATCDADKKRVFHLDSLGKSKLVAITVTVPSDVKSGKVTVLANVDAGNADPQKASTSFTVKAKPKPKHSGGSGAGGGVQQPSNPGTVNNPTGSNIPPPQTRPNNNAQLPSMTQTPSTAPQIEPMGNSQLIGTTEGPDEMTFDKLASTQAAWLAALLVAFSLLLTQVRLGKAGARNVPRSEGARRRTRGLSGN